jgi:hypothetical protein
MLGFRLLPVERNGVLRPVQIVAGIQTCSRFRAGQGSRSTTQGGLLGRGAPPRMAEASSPSLMTVRSSRLCGTANVRDRISALAARAASTAWTDLDRSASLSGE